MIKGFFDIYVFDDEVLRYWINRQFSWKQCSSFRHTRAGLSQGFCRACSAPARRLAYASAPCKQVVILAEARIQARLIHSSVTIKELELHFLEVLIKYFFGWLNIPFRLQASYFSLLAQGTSNQKKRHPSFRSYPALLAKISGHETHPSGLHKTQATAGFRQSLPSSLF
ncbi:MAG: hypothetical protein ACAH08_08995 [Methylophilus sp.]|uniref:hypothetical protein n=1 Tax=Methylophilus sp. TaxID=29541 RepID=UPI002BD8574A|nr:hypothetical protein [Methylophilus sp.]HSH85802.1 hypothetical protein [Methylophilus sp.]